MNFYEWENDRIISLYSPITHDKQKQMVLSTFNEYDIEHYQAEVDFDPTTSYLAAKVKIRLFSVNWRYVYRPLTEITPYVLSIPKRDSTRRDIFRALVKAEDRAEAKADRKYPLEDRGGRPISKNVKKNLDYMWLLSDGYKLEVMHRFRVAPPIHSIITREGIRKNW